VRAHLGQHARRLDGLTTAFAVWSGSRTAFDFTQHGHDNGDMLIAATLPRRTYYAGRFVAGD
jgi:hypothetical protein